MRNRTASECVDLFDLDHTLLNTEARWFNPVLERLAAIAGLSGEDVAARFAACNRTGFTFERLFTRLCIAPGRHAVLERELTADLVDRIEQCLYPGVIGLLEKRQRVAKVVLLTAGVESWQRWKIESLRCLDGLIAQNDRHIVPVDGSKARIVAAYARDGRVSFVDDSPAWHIEVKARVPNVRHVRPMWPDTTGLSDHPGDGRDWDVACSAAEIQAILSSP